MENYRVMGDTTLYAKWSFPTATPTEFALGTDAFTKSFSWIQTGINSDSAIFVLVIQGKEVPNMVWDERTEEYVQQGTKIEYDPLSLRIVPGDLSVTNNQATFTADEPFAGGVYKVLIATDVSGSDAVTFDEVRFNGTGTAD
ncbi:MAG: hypothetical protein IKC58_05385, partial [Clostridia bacterium]|nr:hypothetical protein [Clostridia bacterium]